MAELVKYTPDSATSRVFLRANGVDFLCPFTAKTRTRDDVQEARFISNPIGLFDIVAPLNEIEFDGSTGISEEDLIRIMKNNQ
jgi:hypothetical protein